MLFTVGLTKWTWFSFLDVNECTEVSAICGIGNKCTNTIGGHVCTCNVGFRASSDSKACVDIDECREDPNACSNGKCINTVGSFLCNCFTGYKLEASAMVCIGKWDSFQIHE